MRNWALGNSAFHSHFIKPNTASTTANQATVNTFKWVSKSNWIHHTPLLSQPIISFHILSIVIPCVSFSHLQHYYHWGIFC